MKYRKESIHHFFFIYVTKRGKIKYTEVSLEVGEGYQVIFSKEKESGGKNLVGNPLRNLEGGGVTSYWFTLTRSLL